MEDVQKFEPNWALYVIALAVFILPAGIAYSVLGLNPGALFFYHYYHWPQQVICAALKTGLN